MIQTSALPSFVQGRAPRRPASATPAPLQLRPPAGSARLTRSTNLAALSGQLGASAGGPDVRYLIEHATWGFSLPDWAEARGMGWTAWLERQLDPLSIPDPDVDLVLSSLPSLGLTTSQLWTQYPNEAVGTVLTELQYAFLVRAIYSKRQLFERLVAFWTDHFNISQLDDLCLWAKTDDDREVARKHALGTFPEMLRASARSSAMLWYLDNYANILGAPQENYARELMELHTLGVDGPYTEDDVKEVARCFTGWTLSGFGGGAFGEFEFVPALHDTGSKQVLGRTIPAGGGVEDGEIVLDILARHPKTAEFIATKLTRFLLGYEPPASLIARVKSIYLATDGDIKSMVRAILDPNVVLAIPEVERTKLRQPLHYICSVARSGLFLSGNLLELTGEAEKLGQVPYWWPTPDGPPDSLEKWGSAVLPRWTFASTIYGGGLGATQPDFVLLRNLMLLAPGGDDAARINFVLTGGRLSTEDEEELRGYLSLQGQLTPAVLAEAFALAVSSPSYQYF